MQDKISPLTIGVKEACKITGLSESFIYQSCRREDELRLPHIKSEKTHPHNHQRDTCLDRQMFKGIMARLRPYAALLICAVAIVFAFICSIGQASQSAYQEGLMAGKASAQAVAYDQGYAKGYASAMYEVA